MFTVRCAANVLSQVTIICLVNLSLGQVLFLISTTTKLSFILCCDRPRALYDL